MPSSHRGSGEALLLGSALGLAVLAIVVLTWLTVKLVALVVRVCVAHPRSRVLRLAVAAVLLSALLALVDASQHPPLALLPVLSLAFLILVAWGVELYHRQHFLREISREAIVEEVFHQPWLQAA